MKLTIEIQGKDGGSQEEIPDVTRGLVLPLLSKHRDDWSTTLILEKAETQVLFLSMSNGLYAVTEQRGDFFHDLIGDASVGGEIEFVHGGQAAMHPKRFVVSQALAEQAVGQFMGAAEPSSASLRWERQGSSGS